MRVWAPGASHVDLEVDSRRYPMTSTERGWWSQSVDANPAATYGFSLDGGEVLPDPRSAWQPDGVHGLSRLVDHTQFTWRATRRGGPGAARRAGLHTPNRTVPP